MLKPKEALFRFFPSKYFQERNQHTYFERQAPVSSRNFSSSRKRKHFESLLINVIFMGKFLTGKSLSEALFLHQLTHTMTTECSLNYKFNTWKFQARSCTEIVSDIQNNVCTQHVLPMFCKKKSFWQRFICN